MSWDFFGEGMCWCSSTAGGFCNGAKHMGPRWMLKTWQPPLSPSTTSCNRLWFCHNLSPRSSSSCFFWAFSRVFHANRWYATTFGNLTIIDLEDYALSWGKTRWSGWRLQGLPPSCHQLVLNIRRHWCWTSHNLLVLSCHSKGYWTCILIVLEGA